MGRKGEIQRHSPVNCSTDAMELHSRVTYQNVESDSQRTLGMGNAKDFDDIGLR